MNCIKYAVKKIVIPLLMRYVQSETESEKSERYQREFQLRIMHIREQNSKKYFRKVVPKITKDFTDKYGMYPTTEYVNTKALMMFTKDLCEGRLDTLYQEIE